MGKLCEKIGHIGAAWMPGHLGQRCISCGEVVAWAATRVEPGTIIPHASTGPQGTEGTDLTQIYNEEKLAEEDAMERDRR